MNTLSKRSWNNHIVVVRLTFSFLLLICSLHTTFTQRPIFNDNCYGYCFLIPTSNENNFIYSSLKQQKGRQIIIFVVFESRLILYSSKIVCFQVDWFTGYIKIMIEHLWSGALWNIGLHNFLFSINCQTTIAFRAIHSLHFHHLWVCHTVHHIVHPHMWVCHTVKNVDLPHLGFPFLVGPSSSYHSWQGYL